MPFTDPDPADDMPPVTPELVLLRSGAQAVVAALGRKRGEKFLRRWVEILMDENDILPIRPPSQRGRVLEARRQSLAWLRAMLPAMIASLPPE